MIIQENFGKLMIMKIMDLMKMIMMTGAMKVIMLIWI